MTNPENYNFYNEKMKEIDEIMKLTKDDDVGDFDSIMDEFGVDFSEIEKAFNEYEPTLDLGYTKLNENAIDPFYNYSSDS